MAEKINLLFLHSFKSNIWKIHIDYDEELIIVETRDTLQHSTSFSVISNKTGAILLEDFSFEEKWWIGVSASLSHTILFHILDEDHQLSPSTCFLFDLESKKSVWESSSFQFLRTCPSGYLGKEGEEENVNFVLLEPTTSAEKVLSMEEYELLVQGEFNKVENNSAAYPFHYLEGSGYFNTLKTFFSQYFGLIPVKAIDYLEYKGTIIISYYLYQTDSGSSNRMLDNFLLVLDENGRKLLEKNIDSGLAGIGIETFLVIQNQLIFSKNKKEIISYSII